MQNSGFSYSLQFIHLQKAHFFLQLCPATCPRYGSSYSFLLSMSGSFHSGFHSIKAPLNLPLFNISIEKYAFNFIIIFITGFYYCCHHCCFHGTEISCLSTSYLEVGNPSLTFILFLGNTVKTGLKTWKTKRSKTSEID